MCATFWISVHPSASNGAIGCSGQQGLFDGEYANANTGLDMAEGVRARIRVENEALCPQRTDAANTSSVWSLIAENINHAASRGVEGGLAQVGYLKSPQRPDLPRWFYEYGRDDAGSTYHLWHAENGRSPGEVHTFTVQWDPYCGCFAMIIDSRTLAQTTWNPYSYWGYPLSSNPWESQFLGETHDYGTDIAGGDSGGIATVFRDVSLQDSATDDFSLAPCLYTPEFGTSRYGQNGSGNHGCGSWSIFTKGI